MIPLPRSSARPFTEARVWLILAWACTAAFAAVLAGLLLLGRWAELRMGICFFLPLVAVLLLPHGLPNLLLALIAGCTLLSAAGWALDWYAMAWWFDVLLHALNPFVIVAASMVMLWKAELAPPLARAGRFVALATLYGLALGIGWELLEVTYLDLTWPDTLLDLVMDAAGSALGGWFAIGLMRARGGRPAGRRRKAALGQAALPREPVPVRVRR